MYLIFFPFLKIYLKNKTFSSKISSAFPFLRTFLLSFIYLNNDINFSTVKNDKIFYTNIKS